MTVFFIMSFLSICKLGRSLGFLGVWHQTNRDITTDNFGTEISPSIDCHKCSLTSFGAAGEGQLGSLWLHSLKCVCVIGLNCCLFLLRVTRPLHPPTKYYAVTVWFDGVVSLCHADLVKWSAVCVVLCHFRSSYLVFNSHSESMRTLGSWKAQQCKHQLHSIVWTVGKACPLDTFT